jgi:hypothetical protein
MTCARQIKPHFLHSDRMQKRSIGAPHTFGCIVGDRVDSKLPADQVGTRETLASSSGTARDEMERNAPQGPSPQQAMAVLPNSGVAREAFGKTPADAASQRQFGRLHERLARNTSFFAAAA